MTGLLSMHERKFKRGAIRCDCPESLGASSGILGDPNHILLLQAWRMGRDCDDSLKASGMADTDSRLLLLVSLTSFNFLARGAQVAIGG